MPDDEATIWPNLMKVGPMSSQKRRMRWGRSYVRGRSLRAWASQMKTYFRAYMWNAQTRRGVGRTRLIRIRPPRTERKIVQNTAPAYHRPRATGLRCGVNRSEGVNGLQIDLGAELD